MKKTILFPMALALIFMGLLHPNAQGQRRTFQHQNLGQHDSKPYHFGFSLGVNRMNFAIKPIDNFHDLDMKFNAGQLELDTLYSVLPGAENGFHIGIVSNLKLGEQLDLRFVPTLSFGDRRIVYQGVFRGQDREVSEPIESTFIDFPFHLKYKSVRMVNTRAYVLGGFKYSHDLASAEDKDDGGEVIHARIARNDLYYEIGVGFDHYFQFFKFSTEIKGSFGLGNLIRDENTTYSNAIERLNSRMIMISLLFE